ncbi:hypothetical protein [Umezawaea tangerina]|uniref:Secreted protein n=1 Tax=Umezawaea tangerina TaxID=84725 RepID=A0A2T0T4N4_9PSEU|nr:hypothetical protein [Umezawaea tangerina]PRY40630.1 hypothetical protein CLV43_106371 [Umezawaea tangerina]
MPFRPVLAAALLVLVVPTPAAATPACTGVAVAVDLPDGLVVRCAPGDSGDARTALERTGLAVRAGTSTGPYGDRGYVCRIEGVPAAAADACDGHVDGKAHWKVWRVGVDPVAWRGSGTGGGPGALRVCPGSLVGFSYGARSNTMSAPPDRVVAEPGWLPPNC